jgi:peptide/nickel transport system permease protein
LGRYILRRLVIAVPVLLGISIISFLIVQAAPGDPISLLTDVTRLDPEAVAALRKRYGLDEPIWIQYATMMRDLLTGGLRSFRTRQPTLEMLGDALPFTLILMALTLVVSLVIGTVLGVISALRPNTRLDDFVMVTALFGLSVPHFWLGLMAILLFAELLGLLPSAGIRPIGSSGLNPVEMAPYLVLPVAVNASGLIASLARYVRSGMLEALGQDYVRTACAKGLQERTVVLLHALRNSLITVVTLVGVLIPGLLSGSAIVEQVFGVPGIGRLAIGAALGRDYPLIMTINFYAATLVVFFNLVTDVAYSLVDPRVKVHA